MNVFWNLWIIGLTLACLALIVWVLLANRKIALTDDEEPENKTTGHVYDGIEEYDNPLPLWWFRLFVITLVFAVLYLLWFPGLGSFKGLGGWTSVGRLERQQELALEKHSATFDSYMSMSIEDLADDSAAMKMGARLFSNNCAVCHGADGGGNYGYPNLTDKDWLYGGNADAIKHSIEHGRQGNMPAWGAILGEEKVQAVTAYVQEISGHDDYDHALAEQGVAVYQQTCVACHGAGGKGVHAMGAPNLTDDIWLYSGSHDGIASSIRTGRSNAMPAQKDMLKEYKIHVLAAYVYHLSIEYE